MKTFETRHFGEITYDPEQTLSFPGGLPGFPDSTTYLLMSEDESEDTFFWLQSLDEGNVAFTLMDVYKALPDYNPMVGEDELEELGGVSGTPLEIYNIAVIPDDAKQMRVNLKAPVVINIESGLGKQVICENDDYPIRYYIFEEFQKSKMAAGGAA
jgi:flagellar assembly factor FliW